MDWVALLKALRFLDCSANRVSGLPTFSRALASPTRLEEVVAEGNPVRTVMLNPVRTVLSQLYSTLFDILVDVPVQSRKL